jgi:hypothetical protein
MQHILFEFSLLFSVATVAVNFWVKTIRMRWKSFLVQKETLGTRLANSISQLSDSEIRSDNFRNVHVLYSR